MSILAALSDVASSQPEHLTILVMFGMAVGMGMDTFAVAIAVGLTLGKMGIHHIARLAFHFGFFQFLMPIIGYAAGLSFRNYISAYDHWIAFGLLMGIGIHMIIEAFEEKEELEKDKDPTRGMTVIILSLATSIDALAMGVSISLLRVNIWGPAIMFGVVTASMTAIGMTFGRKLGTRLPFRMEIIGGLFLIGLGIKMLIAGL